VTYIKSRTARIFWDNGYKSVGAVAAANVYDLVPVLLQVNALLLFGSGTTAKRYAICTGTEQKATTTPR
jgi:hypothetical protein